jgi:hypothetical protein
MTIREYYDELVSRSQNGLFPSVNEASFECSYRTKDGRKCGIGVLISDEAYKPEIEGKRIGWLLMTHYKSMIQVPDGIDTGDLWLIQESHDRLATSWDHEKFVEFLQKIKCFKNFA